MRIKALALVALLVAGAMSTLSVFASSNGDAAIEPAVTLTSNLTCQRQSSDIELVLQINNNGPDKIAKGRYIVYKYKSTASGPEMTGSFLLDSDFPVGESRVAALPKVRFDTPVVQCTASVFTIKPMKILN